MLVVDHHGFEKHRVELDLGLAVHESSASDVLEPDLGRFGCIEKLVTTACRYGRRLCAIRDNMVAVEVSRVIRIVCTPTDHGDIFISGGQRPSKAQPGYSYSPMISSV